MWQLKNALCATSFFLWGTAEIKSDCLSRNLISQWTDMQNLFQVLLKIIEQNSRIAVYTSMMQPWSGSTVFPFYLIITILHNPVICNQMSNLMFIRHYINWGKVHVYFCENLLASFICNLWEKEYNSVLRIWRTNSHNMLKSPFKIIHFDPRQKLLA